MLRAGSSFLGGFAATILALNTVPQTSQTSEKKPHVCVAERKFVSNCGDLTLFSGTAHTDLARDIAKNLGTIVQPATVGRFNDGEVLVKVSRARCTDT